MYLVDTNVISARAPNRTAASHELAAWMDAASEHLFLSVVTAAEILGGIDKLTRQGATRRADALRGWWHAVEHLYAARILPFDLAAAHHAGRLTDLARARGHDPGFADIAIAATAATHGLTILTVNDRHFKPLGVATINPLAALPPV